MTTKLRAGVLGATGTVGQRFIQLLENHPWFELGAIAASGRSVGKPFHQACSWKVPEPMPEYVRDRILSDCRPGLEVDFVFSGLPSSIAGEVESDFARAGYPVVSNSGNHRMDEDVPLLVPEINPDHLELIPRQQRRAPGPRGSLSPIPTAPPLLWFWRWRRCIGPLAWNRSAW